MSKKKLFSRNKFSWGEIHEMVSDYCDKHKSCGEDCAFFLWNTFNKCSWNLFVRGLEEVEHEKFFSEEGGKECEK
jgi:hypothetical protein